MTIKSSSTPPVTPNRPRLHAVGKSLWIPALLLPFIAANLRANPAETPKPEAPLAPVAVAAVVTPAPAAPAVEQPAPAPVAVPAVQTSAAPAKAVFAKDVRGLSPRILAEALDAMACAKASGASGRDDLLTIIDYSLPSTQPRLWVLDLARGEVLFHELVAHGAGTGENYATRFSNVKDSRQTSLGLFLTGGTYEGGNGYSLKLKGLDQGINDRAEERHIVMHGAWYVSPEQIRSQGRLGRSWGCPALSQEIAATVIDTIKGGTFVYSHHASGSQVRKASVGGACGAQGGGSMSTAVLAR
ncbi:MAG TPA: murein L,D-transpeptidase catalytic domain family protein [Thermoanaerobaculia bacterium]|nr:murein L,D-transpeptidase catalytic domain family protein [Thermoanaerobaculia bacterium]